MTETLKQFFNDAVVEISEVEVTKYAGEYSSPTEEENFVFLQNKSTLILEMKKGEMEEVLKYKGNNRFVFEQVYVESISFAFSKDGQQLTVNQGEYEGVFNKE
ncbi:MAG: hypothetical protein V3U92_02765 [Cellulophaga sp.]